MLVEKTIVKKAVKKVVTPKVKWTLEGKIQRVQIEAKQILRTGENKFSKYSYATEGDYLNEIKPLLDKYNLMVINMGIHSKEVIDKCFYIEMKFHIVDVESPEDFKELIFPGTGRDTEAKDGLGDKGLPKAITMAQKYMLSKVFLLESGDEVDDNKEGDEKDIQLKTGKKGAKEATAPAVNTNADAQYGKAIAMINSNGNIIALMEYSDKLKGGSSLFNKEQVATLQKLTSERIALLDAKNTTDNTGKTTA